jgi:hypothetical protein
LNITGAGYSARVSKPAGRYGASWVPAYLLRDPGRHWSVSRCWSVTALMASSTGHSGIHAAAGADSRRRDDRSVAEVQQFTVMLVGDHRRRVLVPVPLAADIVAAFATNPAAGAFFDSIAQLYRRAYLRYIDATMRRPEERAARIAEVVALLAAGVKQR